MLVEAAVGSDDDDDGRRWCSWYVTETDEILPVVGATRDGTRSIRQDPVHVKYSTLGINQSEAGVSEGDEVVVGRRHPSGCLKQLSAQGCMCKHYFMPFMHLVSSSHSPRCLDRLLRHSAPYLRDLLTHMSSVVAEVHVM